MSTSVLSRVDLPVSISTGRHYSLRILLIPGDTEYGCFICLQNKENINPTEPCRCCKRQRLTGVTHILKPLYDPPLANVPDKHAMLGGTGYNAVQISRGPRQGVNHTLISWGTVNLNIYRGIRSLTTDESTHSRSINVCLLTAVMEVMSHSLMVPSKLPVARMSLL